MERIRRDEVRACVLSGMGALKGKIQKELKEK